MMKSISFALFLAFLLVPFAGAVQTSTDTYAIANTDQAAFTDAITIGQDVYFLMNSAIYRFDLDTYNFTKIFDAGFNYILTSIAYDGTYFYVSGYKLFTAPGTGGPNNPEPVVTCPLQAQSYNLENFTVWKLSQSFSVQKSVVEDMQIQNVSYYYTIQSMKLFPVNGTLYAVIYDTDTQATNVTSYIFQVDFSQGFVQKLAVHDRIVSSAYGAGYWYLLTNENKVLRYTSNFQYLDSYSDSTDNLAMKQIYADGQHVYLTGRGSSGGNTYGGAVEVLSPDLSLEYYRQFNDTYQFYSVSATGKYVLVAATNTLYAIDWLNNTVSYEYTNTLTSAYDLKTEDFVDIHQDGPHALTMATWNNNGTLGVAFGGYYYSDGFLYAYMVLTDKPTELPAPSGAGYFPYPDHFTNLWSKYKYEILAVGVLLVLMMLGGGKHE